MKVFVTLLAVVLGFSTLANAALVDNGNGLIYDTDLDLTWYDAPPVPRTWGEAKDWAASLTLAGTAKGSWRLPLGVGTASPGAKVFPGQGGEMWHLYFDELHNVVGYQSTQTVPFKNLWPTDPRGYWTGTLIAPSGAAWCFWPKDGRIDGIDTGAPKLALAVHSGNVGGTVMPKVNAPPASDAFKIASTAKKMIGTSVGGYHLVTTWGSYGTGNGQFNRPYDVAVDASGNVYVADWGNYRIQKFTSTGAFITAWGSKGTGNGQFYGIMRVAVDASGNVYVTDGFNARIQKFTTAGAFITAWGSYGKGNGQLVYPNGVAVDASGNIYEADLNHRIQKFTSTGVFMTAWGSYGTGNGQFSYPQGVSVDASGNIYVTDEGDYRVQKFSSTGAFITAWGSKGTGDGQFDHPYGIAVDVSGSVYVADTNNNRVQKFGPTPTMAQKTSMDKKKDISSAKSYTVSAAQKSGSALAKQSAIPNVSGQWKSNIGLFYNITQKGNQFEWTVTKTNEKGQGVLKGNEVSASWSSPQGSGSSTGQISAIDPAGKAIQIEWMNGVRFFR